MNYGDKHTEDSLVSRLGRLYGIERGLDCGPNIIMDMKPIFCTSLMVIISTKSRLKSALQILEQTKKRINTMTIQTLEVFIISFRKSFTASIKTKLELRARKRAQA